MSTVGQRIKEIRTYYQLNQKDFAARLGISYGHVSGLEKDKDKPSETLMRLIGFEYDISLDWLELGEGTMFSHKATSSTASIRAQVIQDLDNYLSTAPSNLENLIFDVLNELRRVLNTDFGSISKQTTALLTLRNIFYMTSVLIIDRCKEIDPSNPDSAANLSGPLSVWQSSSEKTIKELIDVFSCNIDE